MYNKILIQGVTQNNKVASNYLQDECLDEG
jgi:hypothetical protein